MKLNRTERDYYIVDIDTDPPLSGIWEASFDEAETWVDGSPSAGAWAWLVAGPDFDAAAVGMDDADTDATITASTVPLLRLKDDPVLDVQRGPTIMLWG